MTTPMHPVISSQISYVGYENDTKELFITFKNGSTFKYEDVPKVIYNNLMDSDSKGRYLNMYVKNIYTSTKIK